MSPVFPGPVLNDLYLSIVWLFKRITRDGTKYDRQRALSSRRQSTGAGFVSGLSRLWHGCWGGMDSDAPVILCPSRLTRGLRRLTSRSSGRSGSHRSDVGRCRSRDFRRVGHCRQGSHGDLSGGTPLQHRRPAFSQMHAGLIDDWFQRPLSGVTLCGRIIPAASSVSARRQERFRCRPADATS